MYAPERGVGTNIKIKAPRNRRGTQNESRNALLLRKLGASDLLLPVFTETRHRRHLVGVAASTFRLRSRAGFGGKISL